MRMYLFTYDRTGRDHVRPLGEEGRPRRPRLIIIVIIIITTITITMYIIKITTTVTVTIIIIIIITMISTHWDRPRRPRISPP